METSKITPPSSRPSKKDFPHSSIRIYITTEIKHTTSFHRLLSLYIRRIEVPLLPLQKMRLLFRMAEQEEDQPVSLKWYRSTPAMHGTKHMMPISPIPQL